MSDFLIIDPILIKISEIIEIKPYPKNTSRLLIRTNEAAVVVKPEIKFEELYLKSALHQAEIARDAFITFTEAYELGQEVIDIDVREIEKATCRDCDEDPDLCNRNHVKFDL
jgi:hypothetical protein